MAPKENAPEGAPKLKAPVPDVVDGGAPKGEGAEPFAGCEPKPEAAGVVALLLEVAPKLNVLAGLFSVLFAAVGVLDAPKPKEKVGLLPEAGAPGVVVAPNAGVDEEPNADVGVDDAPNADVDAGVVDPPKADVAPKAGVAAGFDDEPNADVPLGVDEDPNAGGDEDPPNANVYFEACPSDFPSGFCAAFAPPPKNDCVEEEEVALPAPAPNENADF